ncbi:MAG: hypothetical protein ACJ8J7_06985 [Sulfurifustaceae bacterium]
MVGVPHLTGRQKIRTALLVLACSPNDVARRLEEAYRSAILIIDPQLDLPPELKDEFMGIRAELQSVYHAPNPRTFPDEESRQRWASSLAGRLVTFYDQLIKAK